MEKVDILKLDSEQTGFDKFIEDLKSRISDLENQISSLEKINKDLKSDADYYKDLYHRQIVDIHNLKTAIYDLASATCKK